MNIDNKLIILGLMILLIVIAFDHVQIKSEIFRVKNMEIEQLHQRLKNIERLVKDTKCVQANRDQLYQSDEQDQSCHHHLETQRIKKDFETTKREYDESSFSSQEQINQLDKRVKQLEFLQGNIF